MFALILVLLMADGSGMSPPQAVVFRSEAACIEKSKQVAEHFSKMEEVKQVLVRCAELVQAREDQKA